ncbi:MAG: DNA mismatch repair endonuclease MutL [Bacteroidota bacterium]|nr:DNA mismatch repair endonuclease MutL [Bacteroidota bacterium]
MSDIIHLLPDSVANQIAAGEVIQRPASVVKELVENALDAGATEIQLIVKDAGRTLIQVIDNGKGMSATDARLAFERHATSKIASADDLFALQTMGFRGEALASIAAIAQVELKTRRYDDEVGTQILITGSAVEEQNAVSCSAGCNFSVKNIFFNVPARRKFLKSNQVEWNNILTEFERIALVYPEITFKVFHNDALTLSLNQSGLRQRIIGLMGKNLNNHLIPVDVETSVISITGFIGKPESAKKRGAQQFFFVNGRYMRHPYFHKAVMHCYEQLLPSGEMPPYFLYFQVDPSSIDVNIHPTKTEIKFENEQPIWQIITAAVKEALGKFNAVPSIDFDTVDAPEIPVFAPTPSFDHPEPPKVHFNHDYNPFKQTSQPRNPMSKMPSAGNWEKLYQDFEMGSHASKINSNNNPVPDFEFNSAPEEEEDMPFASPETYIPSAMPEPVPEPIFTQPAVNIPVETARQLMQIKGRYILTSARSGLMVIDQRRAHIRVLFDQYLENISKGHAPSQGVLFPEMIQLSASETAMMPLLSEDLHLLGFEIGDLGNGTYSVNAIPASLEGKDIPQLLHNVLYNAIEKGCDLKEEIHSMVSLTMAEAAAINYGKPLNEAEMQTLIDQLFACPSHAITPDGKTIMTILSNDELDKRFK